MEIAIAIERGITSQSELLTTLSTAIIAYLFALILQIRIHNASNPQNKQVTLKFMWTFWVAVSLSGVSIIWDT